MERVFFVGGELTVDVMAAEIGILKIDLLKATRTALAQEASTLVEFNDALYGVCAAATGRFSISDRSGLSTSASVGVPISSSS